VEKVKDLYVKLGKLAKDRAEIEVFVRSSWFKGELAFNRHIVRLENVNGHLRLDAQEEGEEGFMCAECHTAVMSGRADGSWQHSKGRGLCAMCASSEPIFHKWIGYADRAKAPNEYVWKGT